MSGLSFYSILVLALLVFVSKVYASPPNDFSLHIDQSIKEKLDPSLLLELERQKPEGESSLHVIVRTGKNVGHLQRKRIEEAGLTIDSIFGDIFTATGPLAAVLQTASFAFVVYIELSQKLEHK